MGCKVRRRMVEKHKRWFANADRNKKASLDATTSKRICYTSAALQQLLSTKRY